MGLREALIKTVAATRPSLFYYKSNAKARQGIKVVQSDRALDILRPADKAMIRISRQNYIYIIDMIESFDYFFDSAEPVSVREHGGNYHLVDFSTPRLQNVSGFADFPILCPSLTEPFSSIQQYLDFAQLKPGDNVFDLGAYSALTSIAFSKAVGPVGRVVALEPDPMNFKASTANIASNQRVNGLDNITLIPAAISDQPGILQFSSEGAMGSSLTSIVGRHRGHVIDVECIMFADLMKRCELDRVDFIKMDIEGAELATILGSGDFLASHRPRMIIEPHFSGGQITSNPIVEFLTDIGYKCSVIDQPGLSLPLVTADPGPCLRAN
jgi:FkbM family methyltransferase